MASGIQEQINNNAAEYKKLTIGDLQTFMKHVNLKKSNSALFACGSAAANQFYNLLKSDVLKSNRIFNPSNELIRAYFTDKRTIKFLKECRKISKQLPGLKHLNPKSTINPADLERLRTFLFLFNAEIKETYSGWTLMYFDNLIDEAPKEKHYKIVLYDDATEE